MYGQWAGNSVNAKNRGRLATAGFTLVELSVSLVVISILVISLFGLFITLVHSATIARQRAVALTLATNQMEYLKSLPYDSLVVIGGAIGGTATIPATTPKTVNGAQYTVKTSINYVDDAYDNCGNIYGTTAIKIALCRGATVSTPTTDTSFYDYKIAHVTVTNAGGTQLASEDTQISARVSETNSNTGAFVVTVVDGSGTPVEGAAVSVTNTTTTPNVNLSDTTDNNGIAIFYKATPDNGNDYVVSASKTGYSSLNTIAASGSLQPTYANQKVIAQQASTVTLKLYPMTANSLVVETTDTAGSPLASAKIYAKGGYKKYTAVSDTSYYYDNTSAVTTDASGFGAISNLAPVNGYIFCNGDNPSSTTTNCSVGATKYYLAAAVPYGGANSLSPITIPTYFASNPPTTTYTYTGTQYVQQVRLMLTTSSTFPRVYTMDPYQLSLSSSGSLTSFQITLTGYNLASATAKLVQGATTYNGTSCVTTATQLKCNYNLTGIATGTAQLVVTNAAGTLTLPVTPLGGFNVSS